MHSYASSSLITHFALACVLVPISACTDSEVKGSSEEFMAVAEMRDAIDFVETTLLDVHFETVNGAPQGLIDAFEVARTQSNEPMVEEDFYFVLAQTMVSLEDAHTRVLPDPESWGSNDFIDLPFTWLDEGLIVTRDTGSLVRGDRVVTLGGVNTDAFEDELSKFIPAENRFHVHALASQYLVRGDVLRHLGLIDADGSVAVEIDRAGDTRTVTLGVNAPMPVQGPERNWVGYEIYPDESIAVFWLDRCQYDEEYNTTLREFMTDVAERGVEEIAVDLRHNPGGDSRVAFALLSYLELDYESFGVEQRISPKFLEQNPLYDDEQLIAQLEAFGVDTQGEIWTLPGELLKAGISAELPPVPEGISFSGPVHAFIGPETFSSGTLFATLLHDNQTGLLVGEPSGNEINFHGEELSFEVPGTSLQLVSSSSRIFRPDSARPNLEALLPDTTAPLTRMNIIDGTDPALAVLAAR